MSAEAAGSLIRQKDLLASVKPVDDEMKTAINSLTLLVAASKDIKSRIETDMENLLNPDDVHSKLELIFKKLKEESINPKLLQPPFHNEAKPLDFMLPPPALQEDTLFNVVYVDEVRDRIAKAKKEGEKLKVVALILIND